MLASVFKDAIPGEFLAWKNGAIKPDLLTIAVHGEYTWYLKNGFLIKTVMSDDGQRIIKACITADIIVHKILASTN